MDHHSWRPRPPPPPIHSNLCPTCSISHFPFCPPAHPLSFNQNPRFPSSTPFFDHPLPNLHRHFPATPGDRFGDDPHSWHRNPSFEYDHGGAGFKRMRVDEIYSGRSSIDDERRLKLIRDHGGLTSDPLLESSVLDTSFGNRNDTFLKPQINYGMNEFRDSRFISDFDRKGTSFSQDPDFGPNNTYGDDERSGQKRLHSYRDEEIGHNSNTGEREYYYHHSVHSREPLIEQRSSFTMENCDPNNHLSQPYAMQNHMHTQINGRRQLYDGNVPSHEASLFGTQHLNKRSGHVPNPMQGSFNVQPPLPGSPPPPLPVDPPSHHLSEPHALYSPAKTSSSLFPIPVSSAATVPSLYVPNPEGQSLARPYFRDKSHLHASTGFATQEFQTIRPSSTNFLGEGQPFPVISSDKPKVVDASLIFKQPHRVTRPDHIVIILRGLPGSGKSYLAKMLRDLEVDNGGDAPRIHSIDDYFMTEVEKVEESDVSKSSGSVRGKKPGMKKVVEYCFEPEMEEAYRSSMLKAFKRTLDEGAFSFVIVDDRNLRVADFAQFWATAKRSGYEVYLLEATYTDPAGCAARNVHGFTQDDIQKMAGQWEEASSLYLKLDVKSLFQGDDLKESGIQEVDMDTEDGDSVGTIPGSEERNSVITVSTVRDYSLDGSLKDAKKWDAEGDHLREEVKELGRSKWSNDLDDDNAERADATKRNLSALSGLIKAYAKEGKSVHWGDQVGKTGFSIGAARKENTSLVIGPGAGYNLKSNPLPEEQTSTQNTGESKRQSVFQERIRAERESFRAVFDKRRQRIGGLDLEDE